MHCIHIASPSPAAHNGYQYQEIVYPRYHHHTPTTPGQTSNLMESYVNIFYPRILRKLPESLPGNLAAGRSGEVFKSKYLICFYFNLSSPKTRRWKTGPDSAENSPNILPRTSTTNIKTRLLPRFTSETNEHRKPFGPREDPPKRL